MSPLSLFSATHSGIQPSGLSTDHRSLWAVMKAPMYDMAPSPSSLDDRALSEPTPAGTLGLAM
jgi:hypothetical protein